MFNTNLILFLLINFTFISPDTTNQQDSTTIQSDSLFKSIDTLNMDTLSFNMDTLSLADSNFTIEKPKPDLVYPIVENNAFQIGEKLTFKVRYGFVRAGTATMTVLKETELNGHPVYQIQTTAESVSPFSWVYKVDDVCEQLYR